MDYPPNKAEPNRADPASGERAGGKGGDAGSLGRELGGDLECVGCGYNLRGLSIRGQCPECGIGIRATILALVDPLASELRPIRFKRLVAAGLVVWMTAAGIGAILAWLPHVVDMVRSAGVRSIPRTSTGTGVPLCAMLSGLGAIALVRPHAGIARSSVLAALAGVLLYVPLCGVLWMIHGDAQAGRRWQYPAEWAPDERSMMLGVSCSALVGLILLCLRPNVRVLVARSLVMRSGRVDRQTMYGMAAAAGLVVLGHVVGYTATARGWTAFSAVGLALVALGSVLLTIGLVGGVADSVRIARAVLIPSPSLRQVIRHGHNPKSAVFGAATGARPMAGGEGSNSDGGGRPQPGRSAEP
jgi:hypothetical protein